MSILDLMASPVFAAALWTLLAVELLWMRTLRQWSEALRDHRIAVGQWEETVRRAHAELLALQQREQGGSW